MPGQRWWGILNERKRIRQFEEFDWRELHEYYSDEVAATITFGDALKEGETWRAMCSMIGHWQVRGYGPYAGEDKPAATVIEIEEY